MINGCQKLENVEISDLRRLLGRESIRRVVFQVVNMNIMNPCGFFILYNIIFPEISFERRNHG
jgi:hypothetical protein